VENSEIKTNRLKESLFSMWELLDSPGVSRAHVRSNTLFRRARLYAQLEEGNAAQRSIVRGDSHEYHLRTLVHCRDGHTGHFRILDGRDGGGPAIRLSPSGQYHMALCGFAARVSALPGSPTSRSRRSYPAVHQCNGCGAYDSLECGHSRWPHGITDVHEAPCPSLAAALMCCYSSLTLPARQTNPRKSPCDLG